MTVTLTDLFCGAGGSSLGATAAGGTLMMAANHWQTAIDVHQAHFPNAGHDCADISQADPRRYPRTDILLASPECTNHSQARGVSRKRQDPTLWDAPDPTAERSRATMWDVVRFAEQLRYTAVIVENVVEATKWVLWPAWWQAMESLGYTGRVLSMNSMHHDVPQSRDRIYVVWCRNGLAPNLELEPSAWCTRCSTTVTARQSFKPGRKIGRYRVQWVWACPTCQRAVEPAVPPAARIIDWSLPCPRIGDRSKPLADATRSRIIAGMQRFGWAPIVTAGAGNTFETTPGNRARPITDPLPVQQTTATTALVDPPAAFLTQTAHPGPSVRVHGLDAPHPTVCASDDRLSLIVHLRGTAPGQIAGSTSPTTEPVRTVSAGGVHHALVMANTSNNVPRPAADPLSTVVAGTQRHALLMRNNTGGSEMVTPVSEPARTMTTAGHQSLLLPDDQPALVDLQQLVDACGFRMLEPFEVAAAMAFPVGYIPRDLPKKDQVKLAGNAVTPPVMTWLAGRVIQAIEAAA
jgi:DNA (cytosine-5)-methyltransferase 1